MITIQNGKFNIPDNDRFVGFAGDDSVNSKQIVLLNRTADDCDYTLCLRFDDDSVCTVPLSAAVDGDNTILTWEIHKEQLYASGIVTAQLKTVDGDGSIAHSTKDFFLVGSAVELDEDGGEREYVTPSQLQNSINQALETVSATAPYVGSDRYWYVYDPEKGDYKRTAYHISGVVDSAVSDSSSNPVGNRYIKQYVDAKAVDCNSFASGYADLKAADKVSSTRKVAGLPLTADIGAQELMAALRPHSYVNNVRPGLSSGAKGQLGIGLVGEVFFCTNTDRWVHLVNYNDLYEKMDLVTEVSESEIEDMEEGSIFFSGGALYVKYNDEAVAISKANDVYTKAEIDAMIGRIEALLGAV
ncbi:MAG: hypothetical protein IJV48_07360 [Ruminococcus sp.]|nr:hypothetical protein [Ruminococcus sp.]